MASGFPAKRFSDLNSRRRSLRLTPEQRVEIHRQLLACRCRFESGGNGDLGVTPDAANAALEFVCGLRGNVAELKPENLVELGRLLSGQPRPLGYRSHQVHLFPDQEALPPVAVEGALERFFGWIQSPAFRELNPASQMAVVQVRLLEIHPFPDLGLHLASVFSVVFPLAQGFLLPTPGENSKPDWLAALEQALKFSTDALTQWNLAACSRAYDLAESWAH